MSTISSQYSNRAELADQYKAQQAEKEELERSHDSEMNNLKKSYATEKADLEDRFESSIQGEKLSQYDHLRNLKSQMNREERQFQSASTQSIRQKQSDYLHQEVNAETEGRAKVNQAIQKYAEAEDHERNRALAAETEVRTSHKQNADHIIRDSEKKLNNLTQEKAEFLDKAKETHATALNQIQGHYQEARGLTEKQYAAEALALQTRAAQDLNTKRLANASIMDKFDAKSEDPFYHIKRFESDLLDMGDHYMLRVKVPEYERKQFKVQVAGQEIQLKGVRSSDEKADLEPGRTISTRTYQDISERYALDSPVDGRQMQFREEGDWVEYTIPKFGPNHRVSDQFRKATNRDEDLSMTKEINFKDTLPQPAIAQKSSGETMS